MKTLFKLFTGPYLILEFITVEDVYLTFSFRFHFIKPQQKNTCAHNNTHKAHANGIKKKKRTKYVSTRGMEPKFLRNQKFCKKYNSKPRSEC